MSSTLTHIITANIFVWVLQHFIGQSKKKLVANSQQNAFYCVTNNI